MVAVVAQEIVLLPGELGACFMDDIRDFRPGEVGEALEVGEAVGAAWWRRERQGVEDSCLGRMGRGGAGCAVGVFVVEEDDAGVEEGEAEGPEDGADGAGGKEVVDVDVDGGFWGGGFAGVEGGTFGGFGVGGAG